jgi:hypothetical protein
MIYITFQMVSWVLKHMQYNLTHDNYISQKSIIGNQQKPYPTLEPVCRVGENHIQSLHVTPHIIRHQLMTSIFSTSVFETEYLLQKKHMQKKHMQEYKC